MDFQADDVDEDAIAALFMDDYGEEGDDEGAEVVRSQDGVLPITSSMGASSRAESPPQGQPGVPTQMLSGEGPPTPPRGPPITMLGGIVPTAFEHDQYLQLVVERSDGQLVGAVPVRFDVANSAVLMALPAGAVSTSSQPRSPNGRAPIAPVDCLYGQRTTRGSVVFVAWDADHLSHGRVVALDSVRDENIVAFGRNGKGWPVAQSVITAALALGFAGGEEEWLTCEELASQPVRPTPAGKAKAKASEGRGRGAALAEGEVAVENRLGRIEAAVAEHQSAALREQQRVKAQLSGMESILGRLANSLEQRDLPPGGRGAGGSGSGGRGAPATEAVPGLGRGRAQTPPARPSALRRSPAPDSAPGLQGLMGSFGGAPAKEVGKPVSKGLKEAFKAMGQDSEDEEEGADGPVPKWGPSANEPMGAFLLSVAKTLERQEQPREAKSRKRIFGLPAQAAGSDESGSGSDAEVGGLKGVRGLLVNERLTESMERHPARFRSDMRHRLLRHLGVSEDGPRRAFEYAMQMPIERQRVMGYFLWTLCHLDELMYHERYEEARLATMRGIAMVDQHLLDGHWTTSWPMLGCRHEPAWASWEKTQVTTHRRTFTASPLLNEMWVSASLGKAKDEAWLRKNRFAPGGHPLPPPGAPGGAGQEQRGEGTDPPGKGRARGR